MKWIRFKESSNICSDICSSFECGLWNTLGIIFLCVAFIAGMLLLVREIPLVLGGVIFGSSIVGFGLLYVYEYFRGVIYFNRHSPESMSYAVFKRNYIIFKNNYFKKSMPLFKIDEVANYVDKTYRYIINYSNDNGKTWLRFKNNDNRIETYYSLLDAQEKVNNILKVLKMDDVETITKSWICDFEKN